MLKKLPIFLDNAKKIGKPIIALLLMVGIVAVGCRKYESMEVKGDARLLIFHAAPDAPSINVFANDSQTPLNLVPVNYTPRVNAGSYRNIPSGSTTISVRDVNGSPMGTFRDALTNYIANTPYSLFVIGTPAFRDRWRELTAFPFYIDDILIPAVPASGGRPAGDYNRDGKFDDADRDAYVRNVIMLRMSTKVHIISDNRSPRPTSQFASIRLINGCPDLIDLVPAGTPSTVGNPYGGSTHPFIGRGFDDLISMDFNASLQEFVQVPAVQTMVVRLNYIPDAQVMTIPGQDLQGGKMYTIIISGYFEPPAAGTPRLKYTLVEHN